MGFAAVHMARAPMARSPAYRGDAGSNPAGPPFNLKRKDPMNTYVTHLGRLPAHTRRSTIVNLVSAEFKKATETSNELFRQLQEEKAKVAELQAALDKTNADGCDCAASRIQELERAVAAHQGHARHNGRMAEGYQARCHALEAKLTKVQQERKDWMSAAQRREQELAEARKELDSTRVELDEWKVLAQCQERQLTELGGGLHPDFLNRAIDLHDLLHEISEEDPHAVKFKVSNPAMTGFIVALSHALRDFHDSPCPSNEG